jgi:hypothetical protein
MVDEERRNLPHQFAAIAILAHAGDKRKQKMFNRVLGERPLFLIWRNRS